MPGHTTTVAEVWDRIDRKTLWLLVRLSSRKEERGGEGAVVPWEVKSNILPMPFDFYMKHIVCTNPPCECAQERPSTYKRLTQGRGADSLASPLSQLPPVESENWNLNLKDMIWSQLPPVESKSEILNLKPMIWSQLPPVESERHDMIPTPSCGKWKWKFEGKSTYKGHDYNHIPRMKKEYDDFRW